MKFGHAPLSLCMFTLTLHFMTPAVGTATSAATGHTENNESESGAVDSTEVPLEQLYALAKMETYDIPGVLVS